MRWGLRTCIANTFPGEGAAVVSPREPLTLSPVSGGSWVSRSLCTSGRGRAHGLQRKNHCSKQWCQAGPWHAAASICVQQGSVKWGTPKCWSLFPSQIGLFLNIVHYLTLKHTIADTPWKGLCLSYWLRPLTSLHSQWSLRWYSLQNRSWDQAQDSRLLRGWVSCAERAWGEDGWRKRNDNWKKGEGKCPHGTPSKCLNRETLPLSGASKGLDKYRL